MRSWIGDFTQFDPPPGALPEFDVPDPLEPDPRPSPLTKPPLAVQPTAVRRNTRLPKATTRRNASFILTAPLRWP